MNPLMRFKTETFDHTRFNALGERETVPVTLPRLMFTASREDPKEVAKQILHVAEQPHAVLERAADVPGGQVADQTAGVREEMTEVPPETAAAPVHVLLVVMLVVVGMVVRVLRMVAVRALLVVSVSATLAVQGLESGPGVRSDDSVDGQVVRLLEGEHCVPGLRAEDAVDGTGVEAGGGEAVLEVLDRSPA